MSLRRTIASNMAAAAFVLSAGHSAFAQSSPPPAQPAAATATVGPVLKSETHTDWKNPYFPHEVLAGMGLLYLGLCAWAWKRHGAKGAALPMMAGAVTMYGLANPQQIKNIYEEPPTEIVLFEDVSPSQSFNGRAQTTSAAREALELKLKALPNVNVRVFPVGGEKDGVAPDSTRILEDINEALMDTPRSRLGMVGVFTDGIIHDTIPGDYILGPNTPVHGWISGGKKEYDRRVTLESVAKSGIVKKKEEIKFRIDNDGAMPDGNAPVKVSLYQDNALKTTKMVAPGKTETISVDIEHTGANIIEIRVDEVTGEVTPRNNRAFATIHGGFDKLNVLMFTGTPNPNTRTQRSHLKSDPEVNLIHFAFARTADQVDDIPDAEMSLIDFPDNEVFAENLEKFHMLLLDQPATLYQLPLSYQQNIVKYVKNGGALLIVSGSEYAGSMSIFNGPLKEIMPAAPTGQIKEGPFTPRVSERGQRHPVMRGLPGANLPGADQNPSWGPFYRQIEVKDSVGDVVLEGADKKALLILNRHEKGRVALLSSDSLWRWQRSTDKKGPYAQFVGQVAHWLMKNPDLEEEALTVAQQGKDLVITQQTMGDKSTPVTIKAPSGREDIVNPQSGKPGLWTARIKASEMGVYSIQQKGAFPREALINVGSATGQEFTRTVSTEDILRPLTERTHGSIARMTDQAGVLQIPEVRAISGKDTQAALSGPDWVGVRMTSDRIERETEKKPLIPIPAVAALWFALMALSLLHMSGWKNPFKTSKPKTPSSDRPSL